MSLIITYNNTILANSIKFQQSDSGKYYKYANTQSLYLTKDVLYEIKYKIYSENTSSFPFDIYITSSQETQPFQSSDVLGYFVESLNIPINTFVEKQHLIKPQYDGTGSVCLALKYGTYYISDIVVQPYSDVDYSVPEMRITIPTPASVKRFESISLYPIYVGGDNNPVGDTSYILSEAGQSGKYSPYKIVTGSNLIISNDDNLIQGSLFIGSHLKTGVEISGYASALVRSVGYQGFASASQYGKSGFIMYSGSVLQGSGDYYRGVGLELHAGYNNGSLRYRADDSGSFLEISGNLYATNGFFSGTISASVGEIGGWTINNNSIYSSRVTESKVTLYSLQTTSSGADIYQYSGLIISNSYGYSGFVMQTGSDDGALIFVGSDLEYSASNSPFYVNRDGMLYASGGMFEGTIFADAGQIAGWNLQQTSSMTPAIQYNAIYSGISGSNLYIYSQYNYDDYAIFTYGLSGIVINTPDNKYHGFTAQTGSRQVGPGTQPVDGPFLFIGASDFKYAYDAPFYVNRDGYVSASYGKIAGWNFDVKELYSDPFLDREVKLISFTQDYNIDKGFGYGGVILSSSNEGYSAFIMTTGSLTDSVLFVSSSLPYSASYGAPFYVRKDGFLHFNQGEFQYATVGEWYIDLNGLTVNRVTGISEPKGIELTTYYQKFLPEYVGGLILSSSYSGYCGIVMRNNAQKGDPLLFINAPSVAAGATYVKAAPFWVDYTGNTKVNNLTVCGSLYTVGTIYSDNEITAFSDERLKKDIIYITSSLDTILHLQGVKFKKINDVNNKERIGLIAQKVESHLPQVVHINDDGYKSISYGNIVALLIEGMKEQQKEIENLKYEINLLKNK